MISAEALSHRGAALLVLLEAGMVVAVLSVTVMGSQLPSKLLWWRIDPAALLIVSAARQCGAVVLLKGPDTVVAEPAGLSVPVIVSDNEGGSRLAVDHLVALGHRRIGYIGGPGSYTAATPASRACGAPDLTTIACYNDLTAIGALRGLRTAGRRVPEDVSVIGFDDIAAAAWMDLPLSTIVQQKALMGRLAVARLIAPRAAWTPRCLARRGRC